MLLLLIRRATLARGLSHQSPNHLEQTRRPVYISFTLLFFTGPFSPDDGDPRFRAAAATDPSNSSSPCALSDLSPPTKKKKGGERGRRRGLSSREGEKKRPVGGSAVGAERDQGRRKWLSRAHKLGAWSGREGGRGDALCFVGFFPLPGSGGSFRPSPPFFQSGSEGEMTTSAD